MVHKNSIPKMKSVSPYIPTYIQPNSPCASIHKSTYALAFACNDIIPRQRRLVKRYLQINQHADGWICVLISKAASASHEPSQRCRSYNAMPSSTHTASKKRPRCIHLSTTYHIHTSVQTLTPHIHLYMRSSSSLVLHPYSCHRPMPTYLYTYSI